MNTPTVAGNVSRKGFFNARVRVRGMLLRARAPARAGCHLGGAAGRAERRGGGQEPADGRRRPLRRASPEWIRPPPTGCGSWTATAGRSPWWRRRPTLSATWPRSCCGPARGWWAATAARPRPNPSQHVFATYEEAEAELAGKGLEVQVVAPSGVEVARLVLAGGDVGQGDRLLRQRHRLSAQLRQGERLALPRRSSTPNAPSPTAVSSWLSARPGRWARPIADVRGAVQAIAVPATGGDLEIVPLAGWPLAPPARRPAAPSATTESGARA